MDTEKVQQQGNKWNDPVNCSKNECLGHHGTLSNQKTLGLADAVCTCQVAHQQSLLKLTRNVRTAVAPTKITSDSSD